MFLRETEVSVILRRSPAALKRWRAANQGPKFVKLPGHGRRGGSILYDSTELSIWIKSQPVRGGAPVQQKEVSQ